MQDSACLPRPVRSIAVVLLASFLSLLVLPAARSSEIDNVQKPKPPKPTGFPVVPGVYRLNAGAPGFPTDDLEPLRKILAGASVVGLGESIHTSGGYLTMKDRVFRFLVEKMGFRVLAIENNWGATDRVEQFVQTCQGSADEALEAFAPIWRSTEMRDLALWMCDWNRKHKPKDRVHLFGFDIQQPEQDGPGLLTFLQRIGIGPDHSWAAAVRACDGVERFNTQPVADSVYAPCVEALEAIRRHFDQNTRQITKQTSAGDLAWARVRLTSLLGWQGFAHFPNTSPENFASRDAAMAIVLRSIRDLRHRNARTVVWAHNSHVWESPHPTAGWAPMMGTRLREAFGRGYASLGLVGSTVELNVPPPQGGCARETPPVDGSVERKLESLETGGFLLADLVNPANPPFFAPGQAFILALGSVEPRNYFDGLIWLEHADPMVPLDRPACP